MTTTTSDDEPGRRRTRTTTTDEDDEDERVQRRRTRSTTTKNEDDDDERGRGRRTRTTTTNEDDNNEGERRRRTRTTTTNVDDDDERGRRQPRRTTTTNDDDDDAEDDNERGQRTTTTRTNDDDDELRQRTRTTTKTTNEDDDNEGERRRRTRTTTTNMDDDDERGQRQQTWTTTTTNDDDDNEQGRLLTRTTRTNDDDKDELGQQQRQQTRTTRTMTTTNEDDDDEPGRTQATQSTTTTQTTIKMTDPDPRQIPIPAFILNNTDASDAEWFQLLNDVMGEGGDIFDQYQHQLMLAYQQSIDEGCFRVMAIQRVLPLTEVVPFMSPLYASDRGALHHRDVPHCIGHSISSCLPSIFQLCFPQVPTPSLFLIDPGDIVSATPMMEDTLVFPCGDQEWDVEKPVCCNPHCIHPDCSRFLLVGVMGNWFCFECIHLHQALLFQFLTSSVSPGNCSLSWGIVEPPYNLSDKELYGLKDDEMWFTIVTGERPYGYQSWPEVRFIMKKPTAVVTSPGV
jgi:hypothetical protein